MDSKAPLATNIPTANGVPPPGYTYGAPYQVISIPSTEPARRPSTLHRFLRAFVWAVAALTLLHVVGHHVHRSSFWRNGPMSGGEFFETGWPQPSDGIIDKCIGGRNWSPNDVHDHHSSAPYSGQTSFELPASADVLFLLSRGQFAHGAVDVVESGSVSDVVKVDVVVHYYSQDILDRANVCLLTRGHEEHGVGIFTPQHDHRHHHTERDQLRFDVTVHLPTKGSRPLRINAFETTLGLFAQHVGDLLGKVEFGSVSLKSSNFPIHVDSIQFDDGHFKTSNGEIRGTFNTSGLLEIVTSNGRIHAEVGLNHNDGADASVLRLKTSNAPIESEVHLLKEKAAGGKYNVDAQTSNSKIYVGFPTSPVDSILHVDARSSNSPAIVSLHPAYEGTFVVQSSMIGPSLEYSRGVEDPAGKGRQRRLEQRRVSRRGHIEGSVQWGDEKKDAGSVSLKTSNSPAILQL
ncbi:hypothetical protein PLICRDRAFT_27375 [Plicaturopsis crispa FD-325 SS-3]|nr:hypothetical protein PLICRDRAFT_27375 [Plicaturopsis crispa FD-325 SS-3]